MKIGIFSDTHANLEALTAVMSAFKKEGVDKYVCLGDTVGYGASPNECCALIRAKHPHLTPAEVKTLLGLTAANAEPADG